MVHTWCDVCKTYGLEHDHWPGLRRPKLPTTGGMIPKSEPTIGEKIAEAIRKNRRKRYEE